MGQAWHSEWSLSQVRTRTCWSSCSAPMWAISCVREAMFAIALPSSRESGSSRGCSGLCGEMSPDRTGGETQPGGVRTSLYSGRTLLSGKGVAWGLGSWAIGESDLRDKVSGTT